MLSKLKLSNSSYIYFSLGLASIGYLGYRTVKWIIHRNERINSEMFKSAFKEIIRKIKTETETEAEHRKRAIIKIQSTFRTHQAQKAFKAFKANRSAATLIQSVFRRHAAIKIKTYRTLRKKQELNPHQPLLINSKKAILEHRRKNINEQNVYATLQEGLPSIEAISNSKRSNTLNFTLFPIAAEKGLRPSMEDEHLFLETREGIIAAVFDGHGGEGVARYAKEQFEKRFFEKLNQMKGNVRSTFKELIDEIHSEVVDTDFGHMGTTAVVTYIDKRSHLIYTATLGDSEANIYRSINEEMKSVPLSCVRDWNSKSDRSRVISTFEGSTRSEKEKSQEDEWPTNHSSKFNRFRSLNISRAIGDVWQAQSEDSPGVSHKPKITINLLQPGDILVLTCDGLKDFVDESEIISILQKNPLSDSLANDLANSSVSKQDRRSNDNVTVIVIKVD